MMKKMLAATAVALGLAAGLAPTASADQLNFDWYDATYQFVAPLDPGGIGSGSAGGSDLRSIVVSPWGTSRLIECRGDGHYMVKECRQEGHWLVNAVKYPFRDTWIYNPF